MYVKTRLSQTRRDESLVLIPCVCVCVCVCVVRVLCVCARVCVRARVSVCAHMYCKGKVYNKAVAYINPHLFLLLLFTNLLPNALQLTLPLLPVGTPLILQCHNVLSTLAGTDARPRFGLLQQFGGKIGGNGEAFFGLLAKMHSDTELSSTEAAIFVNVG